MDSKRTPLIGFPDVVDEISARMVAGGVVLLSLTVLVTGQWWGSAVIAAGFVARVLTGPRLSPLGLLVTRVIRPLVGIAARPTPGPPKRFAQGIGATLSLLAVAAWLLGATGVTAVALSMIVVAATLESVFGFCLGCVMFRSLMQVGVIPESVCEDCADISRRLGAPV